MQREATKYVLLCLHGWGGSKESFTELCTTLAGSDFAILTPDLPGFGAEPEPDRPWSVDDYAAWVESWFHQQRTENGEQRMEKRIFVLGHSHGGRIAITLAVRGNMPIAHLFLCAAAGIRRPRHWKRMIGLTLAKSGKWLLAIPGLRALRPTARMLLYRLVRVHDYERASLVMQQTLIRVTAEDLRPLLPRINVPTDIFWGEDDRMTPIADAIVMHHDIRGSRLHRFPGIRHAVHREAAHAIAAVIRTRAKEIYGTRG